MPRNERFHYLRMLGVEVFRDKQGQGGKSRDAAKEEMEQDAENIGAGGNEEEVMDSENGGENGSLEAKAGGQSVGASS